MGLFGKLNNPAWHEIQRLDPDYQDVLIFSVHAHRFIREQMDELLVQHTDLALSEMETPIFMKKGERVAPFSKAIRERLVDEALLAFFFCCRRTNLPEIFRVIDTGMVSGYIAMIAMCEINNRLQREEPNVREEKTPYSFDVDEARTQLLFKWMAILGLEDARFVAGLTEYFFADAWTICTQSLLEGLAIGFQRNRDAFMDVAQQDCASLSEKGQLAVKTLATGWRQDGKSR